MTLEFFQCGKPLIEDLALAIAACRIQIDAAVGTQPPAEFRAERLDRDLQQDLLQDHRVQIDDFALIKGEIEILGAQLHLLPRLSGRRGEGIFEGRPDLQVGRLQTAATRHLPGRCHGSLDEDIFPHPADGADDVDPGGLVIAGCRSDQVFPEPLRIPLEPKGHPPFGDLVDVDLQNVLSSFLRPNRGAV